jgi:hypothetical protein
MRQLNQFVRCDWKPVPGSATKLMGTFVSAREVRPVRSVGNTNPLDSSGRRQPGDIGDLEVYWVMLPAVREGALVRWGVEINAGDELSCMVWPSSAPQMRIDELTLIVPVPRAQDRTQATLRVYVDWLVPPAPGVPPPVTPNDGPFVYAFSAIGGAEGYWR